MSKCRVISLLSLLLCAVTAEAKSRVVFVEIAGDFTFYGPTYPIQDGKMGPYQHSEDQAAKTFENIKSTAHKDSETNYFISYSREFSPDPKQPESTPECLLIHIHDGNEEILSQEANCTTLGFKPLTLLFQKSVEALGMDQLRHSAKVFFYYGKNFSFTGEDTYTGMNSVKTTEHRGNSLLQFAQTTKEWTDQFGEFDLFFAQVCFLNATATLNLLHSIAHDVVVPIQAVLTTAMNFDDFVSLDWDPVSIVESFRQHEATQDLFKYRLWSARPLKKLRNLLHEISKPAQSTELGEILAYENSKNRFASDQSAVTGEVFVPMRSYLKYVRQTQLRKSLAFWRIQRFLKSHEEWLDAVILLKGTTQESARIEL